MGPSCGDQSEGALFRITFLGYESVRVCDGAPPGSDPSLRAPTTQINPFKLESQRWWSATAPRDWASGPFGSPPGGKGRQPSSFSFSQIPRYIAWAIFLDLMGFESVWKGLPESESLQPASRSEPA